jgi:prophage tail gpP-like protein
MATPAESVTLLIGGYAHQQWESYDLDSDFLVPADAFRMSLGIKDVGDLPDYVAPWAPVEVRVGDEVALKGRLDGYGHYVSKQESMLGINGRDLSGVLLDCSAPIFSARQVGLEEIVAKVIRPLGLTQIRIDADSTRTREKINVEPGDRAWDVVQNVAEANGLWPWFDPDGTLVIGGPDYEAEPVATLVMRRSGKGNNMISLEEVVDVTNQFSQVTVLGQAHGTETETGRNAITATAYDRSQEFFRPQIFIDHECDTPGVAQDRATKLLTDGMFSSLTLVARVKGHHVKPGGSLWKPGQRVGLVSEPHKKEGIFFISGRRFVRSSQEGTFTELTLKLDGIWTISAHPHNRKHRRGRNDPGVIIDVE